MQHPHLISLADWHFARLVGELLEYLEQVDPKDDMPVVADRFSPHDHERAQSLGLRDMISRARRFLRHLNHDLVAMNAPDESAYRQALEIEDSAFQRMLELNQLISQSLENRERQ